MPSTKSYLFAVALLTATSPLALSQEAPGVLTVAEKIALAEQIAGESMRSKKAEMESNRLANENEVARMRIEERNLRAELSTSETEIQQMRSQLETYRQLINSNRSAQNQSESTRSQRRQQPAALPLNMRVLNILSGDNVTTRARVVVLSENGSAKGEFQIKEGGSIQGWNVDRIDGNSIQISKGSEVFIYGSDGMM
jgi:hypothetical protein